MLFWIITAATAIAAGIWIARPYLKTGEIEMNDGDSAISVFRDQLDEIDHDLDSGLINVEEHAQAKREIERRTLTAARHMGGGFTVSHRSIPVVLGVVAVSAAVTFAGYVVTGQPQAPDQPLAARKTEMLERRAAAGDINSRIQLMIDRTSENPQSFDDWWTLAVSYASIEDHASAVDAYRKAAELGGDKPGVMSAYAESMTLANGNKVPDAARLIFQQVLNRTYDVRARYYLALYKAQAQDFEGAIEDWSALAKDSKPDAPWMPLVRRDITNMARFLKVDLADYLPDASEAEIAQASGTATPDSDDRLTKLQTILAEDEFNYKGWIELAQLHAARGDDAAAAAAIEEARQTFAAAPFILGKIDEAAQALGLDMVAPGVSGPTAEDIANASGLSKEEQDDMVDGMVAGLAAKLEDNPNNPDGWIMLVRSYVVMGQPEKARESLADAARIFEGDSAVLARLNAEAASMLTD